MPVLLPAASAVTWAGTITADVTGADDRIWLPLLGAALVSSLAALLAAQVTGRIDRFYIATAKAAISRPADPRLTPAPWPALRAVQPAGQHRPPGRHASR